MNMEKNTKSKAVVYCRVSTKEQVEEGNSLATQERNCREYAIKHDYEITQVFIEEGESAKTADRTELQKLLRFCSDKKQNINAVIIYKIDRLSRNTDDYSQLRILLKRYGVEIKSTSEYFENTPAGRFMENIIANVAQFDNDVRTERSVGGMRDAVREGRYVWMAPVGYTNQKVDGKSNIVPNDKAILVKKAFEMMAARNHSINAIRESIAQMGLPQARSNFYKMLKNELYAGWICKLGERHRGKFEPIISEELFTRVQQVMKIKKMPMLYKIKHPDFPLRRFVQHPDGFKLTGAWSKGRNKSYAYYRFIKTAHQWPKNDLEAVYGEFIDRYSIDIALLERIKVELVHKLEAKSKNNVQYIEGLSQRKQQLKETQSILLQKGIKGIISDTLLKENLEALDGEIWEIDKQLQQKESRKVNTSEILDFVSQYLQHPSQIWKKMPLDIRIKLQWFQFPDGVLFDGKEFRTAKISGLFKLKDFFLADMSSNVHHRRLYYKQPKSANSSPLQNENIIVWPDIVSELKQLEEILSPNNKSPADHSLVSSISPPP
ncbi:MAG: recombinase family protein [Chitinophagales bacterium]|nr:recombinase family protein [Chitinophagales bacterium]